VSEDDRDAIDEAAIAWTKAWGKQPLEEGVSFRDRLRWKGVSLWWFAELFLHHSTRAPALVRTVETMLRVLERLRPEEVEAVGLDAEEALLLARACSAQRVLFHGTAGRAGSGGRSAWRVSMRSRWNTMKTLLGAAKTRLSPRPAALAGGGRSVLFLPRRVLAPARWRPRGGRAVRALLRPAPSPPWRAMLRCSPTWWPWGRGPRSAGAGRRSAGASGWASGER
jgi:hypothetical protein